jgi:hypothetical protein
VNPLERLRRLVSTDRQTAERLILGILTLLVAVVLGSSAARRRASTSRRFHEYQNALQTVTQFRVAYRPVSLDEEKRWRASVDSLMLGLPAGNRLAVIDSVTRIAESRGLRDVRVRFAAPDSTFIPSRGEGPGGAVSAGYTVTVNGGGSYADVLGMIGALPAFVSVIRADIATDLRGVRYHLVLAVYESSDGHRPG